MNTRYETRQRAAGEGGFGRVDKCFDNYLLRDVAVKILDPLFRNITSKDIERFQNEGRALAKLTHPNIPAIYDIQMDVDNEFRIIFQWIEGRTIREYLAQNGQIALDDVKKYFYYICNSLAYIHDNSILHRDIKPSNIIITSDNSSCYLVDLGISLNKDDVKRLTGSTPIGTPGYMSPEQQAGEDLTPESDIYALGILLYECLSGRRPSAGHYDKLVDINETIPPAVDDLILKSLSSDINQRQHSAKIFYTHLENALQPQESLSEILTDGTLFQIQSHIISMDNSKFSKLKLGQKSLLIVRLKDLINVNSENMKNATASFLNSLLKHAHTFNENDFEYLIEKSFEYGFNVKYSERWRGNESLRERLAILASNLTEKQTNIFSKYAICIIEKNNNYETEDRWYYHCLRDILQSILASNECPDDIAPKLAAELETLNNLSHQQATIPSENALEAMPNQS